MNNIADRLWPPKFKKGDIVRRLPRNVDCQLNGIQGKVMEIRRDNSCLVQWEPSDRKEAWPITLESEHDLEKECNRV